MVGGLILFYANPNVHRATIVFTLYFNFILKKYFFMYLIMKTLRLIYLLKMFFRAVFDE